MLLPSRLPTFIVRDGDRSISVTSISNTQDNRNGVSFTIITLNVSATFDDADESVSVTLRRSSIEDNAGNLNPNSNNVVTAVNALSTTFIASRIEAGVIEVVFNGPVTVTNYDSTSDAWSISDGGATITGWTNPDGNTANTMNITFTGITDTSSTPTVTYTGTGSVTIAQRFSLIALDTGTDVMARDRIAPNITDTSVVISSSNSDDTQAMLDDIITLHFTTSEPILRPTVLIAGMPARVIPVTDDDLGDGRAWNATITVTSDTPQGVVTFNITEYIDTNENDPTAKNQGVPYGANTDAEDSPVTVDSTPTMLASFNVSSSNDISNVHAKDGATITIEFESNDVIMPVDRSDVQVNGITVSTITDRMTGGVRTGFNATIIVNSTFGSDGLITISATVEDAASNTATFTHLDLTSSNVEIDRTPPVFLEDETFFITASAINILFNEPMYGTDDSNVTNGYVHTLIANVGQGIVSTPRYTVTTGTGFISSLITWIGEDELQFAGDLVSFSITSDSAAGNELTDLAGNPIASTGPHTYPRPMLDDIKNLDISIHPTTSINNQDFVPVRLSISSLIENIISTSSDSYPLIRISSISPPVDDTGVRTSSQSLTIQHGLATLLIRPSTQIDRVLQPSGPESMVPDAIQISPAIPSSYNASTDDAFHTQYQGDFDFARHSALVQIGDPVTALTLDKYAKITIPSLLTGNVTVFSISSPDGDGNAGDTKRITACQNVNITATLPGTDDFETALDTYLSNTTALPANQNYLDYNACHIAQDIWTRHFTVFGSAPSSSRSPSSSGGGGCDGCTPPTLGYNSRGQQLVSDGFSYNGNPIDVEYYFTPYPLITTDVGKENIAVFKIYDDQGPDHIMHFSMAFGLRTGDVISESKAMIEYDIDFQKNTTVTITDPENTIDNDTVRVETNVVSCMPGTSDRCLEIMIYHTFRAPLDFDIVASDVWDTKRNAWQNYYNHGIHITGTSLNPIPGILVNNDTLRLYPLVTDSTHVKVMVDSGYNLYVLTPDGSYQPLRNVYALYHEIDTSMYSSSEIRTSGIERNDPRFSEHLLSQIEIAQIILLDEIQQGQQITNDKFFNMENNIDLQTPDPVTKTQ